MQLALLRDAKPASTSAEASDAPPSAAQVIAEAQKADAREREGLPEAYGELVDSLAYFDVIDGNLRAQADALVAQEQARMGGSASDYLAQLPAAADVNWNRCPLAAAAYERVAAAAPREALDFSRYELPEPAKRERSSAAAWAAAASNAKSQLEHQNVRIENLELLHAHGADVWRASRAAMEGVAGYLNDALEEIERETEDINRDRKLRQLAHGREISRLEGVWAAQIRKNEGVRDELARLGG